MEFNDDLLKAGATEAIPEGQTKHINAIIVKLRDPKIYSYISSFTSFEQNLVPQLTKWPSEKFIPVLDLMRILVNHHASGFFFSGLDSGLSLIVNIVSKLGDAKPVVWKLFFKFLSNLNIHTGSSIAIVKAQDILFDCFAKVPTTDKGVLGMMSSFLMTFSSNFDVVPTSDTKLAERFNSLIGNILANDASGNGYSFDVTSKLAIAVINFSILGKSFNSNSKTCA